MNCPLIANVASTGAVIGVGHEFFLLIRERGLHYFLIVMIRVEIPIATGQDMQNGGYEADG